MKPIAIYPIMLLGMFALSACQGNETPKPAAPQAESTAKQAAPAAKQSESTAKQTEPTAKQAEATVKQAKPTAKQTEPAAKQATRDKAMAVRKPAADHTAQEMQQLTRSRSADIVREPSKPAAAPQGVSLPVGDAQRGKSLARKCQSCHNFDTRRKVGPGLAGIVGRQAGSMPDMRYSAALKAGGWHWDEAHLAAWICDSKAAVKRFRGDPSATTKMPAQRICDPQRQADVIAFLKTL